METDIRNEVLNELKQTNRQLKILTVLFLVTAVLCVAMTTLDVLMLKH